LLTKRQKRQSGPDVFVTATRTYDALARLKQITYSDATPAVTYTYDDPAVSFAKGRLTKVETSTTKSEILSYDALGRVLKSKQTIGISTFQFGTALQNGYEYTPGDGLKSIRYPSGRVVTTGFHNNGWAKTLSGLLDGQTKNYIGNGITYSGGNAKLQRPVASLWSERRADRHGPAGRHPE
jgi:hypothetical protein